MGILIHSYLPCPTCGEPYFCCGHNPIPKDKLTTTYEISTSLTMASATIERAVNGTSQFLTYRINNA